MDKSYTENSDFNEDIQDLIYKLKMRKQFYGSGKGSLDDEGRSAKNSTKSVKFELKCDKGHVLEVLDEPPYGSGGIQCDITGNNVGGDEQQVWYHCRQCQYDVSAEAFEQQKIDQGHVPHPNDLTKEIDKAIAYLQITYDYLENEPEEASKEPNTDRGRDQLMSFLKKFKSSEHGIAKIYKKIVDLLAYHGAFSHIKEGFKANVEQLLKGEDLADHDIEFIEQ